MNAAENEGEKSNMKKVGGVLVGDPEILRPKTLPLVIKPESGEWENDEQAQFAKTLNGYAYKNSKSWKKKKNVLVKQLIEIGKNPDLFYVLSGRKKGEQTSKLTFSNKLLDTK